ncbi:MAG: cytochrome c oxidase assembly protein [Alphaproteobacteria bacterium]|nr:cytochrome c oxidase assembly protein [Alphaproteobacteria bacterium]
MAPSLAPPYCGAPPTPSELWSRWNLDPVLIGLLLAVLGLYWAGARLAGVPRGRRLSFYAGWALSTAALISPLCPLSVALFSARVGQHMFLTTIAAPIVVIGRPQDAVGALWRRIMGREPPPVRSGEFGPLWAAAAYGVLLWWWHSPAPYAATFHGDLVYWTMHLSLYGSALWLWATLLEAGQERFAVTAAAIALTSLQMGVLGAVITFAPRPLYAPHLLTAWWWGLSPLGDQQLGGAIMWAPSGAIFAGGLAWAFAAMLRRAETRSLQRSLA